MCAGFRATFRAGFVREDTVYGSLTFSATISSASVVRSVTTALSVDSLRSFSGVSSANSALANEAAFSFKLLISDERADPVLSSFLGAVSACFFAFLDFWAAAICCCNKRAASAASCSCLILDCSLNHAAAASSQDHVRTDWNALI